MRGNIDNLIFGGDFNAIISEKDVSKSQPYLMSNNLLKIYKDLKLKDIHNLCNTGIPQYTYIKEGYGSRIDMIYVNKLRYNISNFRTIPVAFSDHHAVLFNLNLANIVKYNYTYWKFNKSIIDDKDAFDLLKKSWVIYVKDKSRYNSCLEWWDNIKLEVSKLFIKIGKLKKSQKFGLLHILEDELKCLNVMHQKKPNIGFNEMQSLKAKINLLKEKEFDGVKIRARLKDKIEGEKVSSYLIGKQKQNSDQFITALTIENNLIYEPKAIMIKSTEYFRNLYSEPKTNNAYDNIGKF